MPIECPKNWAEYNACLGCRYRHIAKFTSEDECWSDNKYPRKLADILTLDERIARLEDILLQPQEIIHRHIQYKSDVSKKQWFRLDLLSGEIKYLREKLNSHIDSSKMKRGKY